jgi:hypothetical protein
LAASRTSPFSGISDKKTSLDNQSLPPELDYSLANPNFLGAFHWSTRQIPLLSWLKCNMAVVDKLFIAFNGQVLWRWVNV